MEVLEKRIVNKSEVDRLTEQFKSATNDCRLAQQAFDYATSDEEIELASQRLMNTIDKSSSIIKEIKYLHKDTIIVDDTKPEKRNLIKRITNLFNKKL